jgi:NUMOD4 motif/HNH endonuclease
MMQEVWLPVVGYEGLYEVSSLGNVRSIPGGRRKGGAIKTFNDGRYLTVNLHRNGTRRKWGVHVLVAAAFLGPRPDGHVVRHGPNGALDNRASELSYGTQKENCADRKRDGTHPIGDNANRRLLTSSDVIRIWYSAEPSPVLAERYGVHETTIRKIWMGKNWGSVTGSLARPAVGRS